MNVEMKKKMGVPASRPVAYFLPTISIKAKDFASEITNVNVYNTTQIEETFLCHVNVHYTQKLLFAHTLMVFGWAWKRMSAFVEMFRIGYGIH